MKTEYHKYYSKNLQKDMEFKIYGHTGKPVLVFPCHGGRFYEWEDFKMFDVLSNSIYEGKYQFFTVDSIDGEPWSKEEWGIEKRIQRHKEYENYIISEIIPFMQNKTGYKNFLVTGMSMGGYHASILALRYPNIFDQLICLSGVLTLNLYIGDFYNHDIEKYTPFHYVRTLNNENIKYQLSKNNLIFCTGQGLWEEETVEDYRKINFEFFKQKIPVWIDFWGNDVSHDWPWWKIQLPYYLKKLLELKNV